MLVVVLALGAVGLLRLLHQVPIPAWHGIAAAAALTLGRVLASTVIGTLWTLPAGLAIGLSPRLSRVLQPLVQILASFPAPMLFPAVFPYLVTGWITAAGGAWNASIVAEYLPFRGQVLITTGLGARISLAASGGDFPALAASITVMAALVVLFNRLVWRRLHRVAEERFSLSR